MSDNPARDGYATLRCQLCGQPLTGRGGKRWCSTVCRQRAWRLAKAAPVAPRVVAKSDTVYECDECEARYLGEQRCPDCNIWCRRLGAGGSCPHCGEPVAIIDIVDASQMAAPPRPHRAPR